MKYLIAVIALTFCASASSIVPAQTDARSFLVTHWQSGSKYRLAAKSAYESSPDSIKSDTQFAVAYAINRLFHDRTSEAIAAARWIDLETSRDLDAWYLKCWLELAAGKTDAAMLSMKSFREALDQKPLPKKSVRKTNLRRMGRLLGYCSVISVAKPNVGINETTFEETVEAILDRLDNDEKEWLNSQRKKVKQQFDELRRQSLHLKTNERERIHQERQKEIAQIQRNSQVLNREADKLAPRLNELEKAFDKKQGEIEVKAAPASSELGRVQATIGTMEQQLRIMYDDLLVTESLAFRSRDRFRRRNLFAQADIIAINIRETEFSLASVYGQAQNLASDLDTYRAELNIERSLFQKESSQLKQQLSTINRQLKRNNRKIVDLSKEPSFINGKLKSIGVKTGALRTYDPFPIETYRRSLLKKTR